MHYSVAIVILNWNGWGHTLTCIESLLKSGVSETDIVLVDNGSTDGSLSNVQKLFSAVHLIQNKLNEGFTGGNNIGMRYALDKGYEYVMLLNNDTKVSPGFLELLVGEMEKSKNLGAIQPLIYYMEPETKIWNAGGKYHAWLGLSETNYQVLSKKPYLTEWISGCAILVRSAILEDVGLFDNRYFAYFEDVDWSLRMRAWGYELKVQPQAIIYHEAGAASKSESKGREGFLDPKVHFLNVKNQIFQLRKYSTSPKDWLAWPFHFAKFGAFIVYFLVKKRRNKSRAVINGVWEGLKTPLTFSK